MWYGSVWFGAYINMLVRFFMSLPSMLVRKLLSAPFELTGRHRVMHSLKMNFLILWSCKLLVAPSTWDTFTVLMDFPTMSGQSGYLNFKVTENEMQISFTVYCSDRNPWKQRTAYVIANHTNVNILLQPFELHSSIALPSYKMPRILAVNYAVWECLLCVYLNMQIGFRIIGPCMLCCCLLSHWNVPEWNCWIILMHCGWITAAR
jgi:hypothetical protein